MTRVLQFTAPLPLHEALLACSDFLLKVTAALGTEPGRHQISNKVIDFQVKRDDPLTWWVDYDRIIDSQNITETGRQSLRAWIEGLDYDPQRKSVKIGAPSGKGLVPDGPMVRNVPGVNVPLLFVTVEDMVTAGYVSAYSKLYPPPPGPEPMPADASTDDPPPFVPDPDFDPDLSIRDTTPPEIEIPPVGWIFLEATGTALGQMDTAARAAGLADDQDQVHRCASNPATGIPRWALKRNRLGPALLSIFGGPYWQVTAPAFSRGWATWHAGASL